MVTDCTDVCDIVISKLLMAGFTVEELELNTDSEDHDKIIECLNRVKFVRKNPN